MSRLFELSLVRVECLHEQVGEWGADEMGLLGFGVCARGTLYATGYRDLGPFRLDDVREGAALGPPLISAELAGDALEVRFAFWLIEEDGGGVRGAAPALEQTLREAFRAASSRRPREQVPFAAFSEAIAALAPRVARAATVGRDDEVFDLVERTFRPEPDEDGAAREQTVTAARRGATYDVTLRHRYGRSSELG